MAEKKDYYKILGVKKDATSEDIKKAYRKLSVKWHPDRNQGSKEAESKFKEIAEAYSVLGDEEKRKEYDTPKSSFKFSNGFDGFDDIFSHFSSGGFNFDFGGSSNKEVRGKNIRINLELSLEEMYSGVNKKIRYKPFVTCSHCSGSGMTSESHKRTCRTCGGTGQVFGGIGLISRKVCPTCGGIGYTIENPCPHCNGHGIVQTSKEVELTIPKGAYQGINFSYSGLGSEAPHGNGAKGDLIVSIIQKPHKKFKVDGSDLHFDLKLKVINVLLGCKVNITTIDGRILQAKIKKGTCDGEQLRFKGYGMPKYGTKSFGNMIATVKLVMPTDLNAKETELLKQLKNEEHFK